MILVPVGGFLGAGKTTLILAAARLLRDRGLRAAAIFNDQGADLVDTHLAAARGVDADQVAGGCFCCRFSDLIDAAERLRAHAPDVIFAEAVGSCTDISATTLQPLKRLYADRFRVAPYSVLVDPDLRRDESPFLFQKQIEEADLICFTRADLYREFPHLEGAPLRYLSGVTGGGVAEWLDELLSGEIPAGGRILDLDYEQYARAEAAFAWMNCTAAVELREGLSPAMVVGPLLEGLDAALTAAGLHVAHLKLIDESASGYLKASLVRNGEEPVVEGMLDAAPASRHELLLNVRAEGDPGDLRRIVEEQLAALPGRVEIRAMQSFRPAPPKPERRENRVYA
jgi:Ni2+-binding GTPase involved in maturation of urease and hydrogenase